MKALGLLFAISVGVGAEPPTLAQATLSLSSATAPPGETVELVLAHAGDGSAVAAQVEVVFDGERLAATVLPGGGLGSHVLRTAEVAPGHWRLVVYLPTVGPLGSELARLRLVIPADAPPGAVPVELAAAVVSSGAALGLPVTLEPGSVEVVSAAAPVVSRVGSVPDTGDGALVPGEGIGVTVTQLVVEFSAPMRDPAGDTAGDDVTNPANYRLVRDAAGDGLATPSCGAPVATGDALVALASVHFDASARRATLQVPGRALPAGRYRLFACGTLASTLGTPLDGNGNGNGGDDFAREFSVGLTNRLVNPNFDHDLAGWTVEPPTAPFAWSPEDVEAAPSSGSAELPAFAASGQSLALAQCVAVSESSSYRLDGRLRIASGIPALPQGVGLVRFFASADCSGPTLSTVMSPTVPGDTADAWVLAFSRAVTSPAAARSAQVSFVLEAGAAPAFTAELDHLRFFESGIFSDGFETGSLARWTAHVP
ncbi:MAG: hypothetical protein SF066_19545 [Thermoanaerobaculia bacterium]|nr:hypothetical protein [Thermoanaerobaculia bacterium]